MMNRENSQSAMIAEAAAADYPVTRITVGPDSTQWRIAANSVFMSDGVLRELTAYAATGSKVLESRVEAFNRGAAADDFSGKQVTMLTLTVAGTRPPRDPGRTVAEILVGGGDDFFLTYGGFDRAEANLLLAAAEFVHSQLAFVDRNAYTPGEIRRFMGLYPEILRRMLAKFSAGEREMDDLREEIAAITSGIGEKDRKIRAVLGAAAEFFGCVVRSNREDEKKTALAFMLDPGFMGYFESMSGSYAEAFPPERPYGVFFFHRAGVFGFQIRFSPIARGGWRTVVPKAGGSPLDRRDAYEYARCELFRECFVLANTQHKKNKDIYEGGSKMVTLLENLDGGDFKTILWSAQRAVFEAFLALLLMDRSDIVEIGPDENMFDEMISYMGDRAEAADYPLGSGIISGKVDSGINHKHYGVTSFGVCRYLMTTLRELGIDPEKDEFSVILSGGPFGDVAGNMIKLLDARREDGSRRYPALRFTAVTDGPAVIFDPAGIDREELSSLVHRASLAGFDPARLSGEGAFMLWSAADEQGRHRLDTVSGGRRVSRKVGRDEYMRIFQRNIFRPATVFVPCGGRPQTVNESNFTGFVPGGKPIIRAVVEGANSFITPAARLKLQQSGIVIVKDASANKCGVITSSYEILSGLLLDKEEFARRKEEVVREIMAKLAACADREAEWLFREFAARKTVPMTELSDELADRVNALKKQLFDLFGTSPELLDRQLILDHLPALYREEFADRLDRIPAPYFKAIAAAEAAGRIVFTPDDPAVRAIRRAVGI